MARADQDLPHALLDTWPDVVFALSPEGVYTFANRALGRAVGQAPEAVVGRRLGEVFPGEEDRLAALAEVVASGAPRVWELTRPGPAGDVCYETTLTPLKGADGRVVSVLGVSRDVTAARRAQAEAAQNHARLLAVLDASPSPVYVADPGTHELLYANRAFTDAFGEIGARKCHEQIQGRDAPCPFCTNDRILGDNFGKVLEWEFENRRSGRWYRCIDRGLTWPDGRVVRYEMALDITAAREAAAAVELGRERLEEAQRIARIGHWEANLATDELYWSDVIFDIFGFDAHTFAPSVSAFRDAVHPDDREAVLESERRSEQTGLHDVVHRVVRPDGQIRHVHELARRYLDEQGNLLRLRGTVQDVTAQVLAESDRRKLEGQLQQAQKMESVGRLAGGVAHDFNNMLGVILGHVELALTAVGPGDPLHEDLTEIRGAAIRSSELTRQLLAFARKQTIAPRVLDLNATVGGMLRMLERLIGEDVDLVWRPGDALWPVHVDPSQVDQILANLCVNARDAIDGVGKMTIETANAVIDAAYGASHAEVVPGDYVRLTVSDDGHGMDRATLGHLFEPFFTTKGVGHGTGLGLATVYGIVKQNRGFINVYSEAGHGTSFTIHLPRHRWAEAPAHIPDAATVRERGHETILLVEDEPSILKLTRRLLELEGYAVVAAATPGEALRLAAEPGRAIHGLLTDVVMPEMNGRDLAERLRAIFPALRTLFMSGYTANVIAHHGVLDEGVNFIQKPVTAAELAAKLRAVLRGG